MPIAAAWLVRARAADEACTSAKHRCDVWDVCLDVVKSGTLPYVYLTTGKTLSAFCDG
jgi:hypothetical protein